MNLKDFLLDVAEEIPLQNVNEVDSKQVEEVEDVKCPEEEQVDSQVYSKESSEDKDSSDGYVELNHQNICVDFHVHSSS